MSTTEVNTKTLTGHRVPHYDDALDNAEWLAGMEVRTRGNWSYGQILKHMSLAMDTMIDGRPFKIPATIQFVFVC